MPNNPKSVFPLKCMTCPQMPHESSQSARVFLCAARTIKYLSDAVRNSEQWKEVQPERVHVLVTGLIQCGILEAANKSPGSFMEVVSRASAQDVEQALKLAKQDTKSTLF